MQKCVKVIFQSIKICCEAQGKGRARGQPRKVTQRSFIDGGWWMVDILSLELTLNLVATRHHPPPPPEVSISGWMSQLGARLG